jgi:lipopolysaccharide export system protein LptA
MRTILVSTLFVSSALFLAPPVWAAPTPGPKNTAKPSGPIDSNVFDADFSKEPTHISANTLTLKNKERVFVYSGNVSVKQGEMTLTSKTLEGYYSENNEIQRMIAKGEVVITKTDLKATGGQAVYEAATETVTLTEGPQVEQNGSILTADKIKVFLKEDRSQAEGQVRVTLVQKKDGAETTSVTATPVPTTKPSEKSTPVPGKS